MHSGPVSPQPAPGLTSSSQLPVSVLHYIQYILFFPFDIPLDKTRLSEISFQLSSVCLSTCQCSRPEAMHDNAWCLSKGIALMESTESLLPCIPGLRRVWTEGIWTWLYRRSDSIIDFKIDRTSYLKYFKDVHLQVQVDLFSSI